MKRKNDYITPKCQETEMWAEAVLCTSAGNEGFTEQKYNAFWETDTF